MLPVLLSEYGLEDEVYAVEQSTNIFTNPTTIKFIVLFAILIIGAIIFVFHPTAEHKKAAKLYLEGMISKIYAIAVANIDFVIDESTGDISIINFDEFKKQITQMIYDDSWSFVEKSVDDAVTGKALDFVAKRLIKKESVEQIVDLVLNRKDIKKMIKDAFERVSNESINSMIKHDEEAKKEAEAIEAMPEEFDNEASTEVVEAFTNPEATEEQIAEVEEPLTEEEAAMLVYEDGKDPEDEDDTN